jgi:hypothetical protein
LRVKESRGDKTADKECEDMSDDGAGEGELFTILGAQKVTVTHNHVDFSIGYYVVDIGDRLKLVWYIGIGKDSTFPPRGAHARFYGPEFPLVSW